MQRVQSILEKISTTSSLKEKEQLLRENESEELFFLLKLHADPYKQFYISKLPTESLSVPPIQLNGSTNFEKFKHLTDLLSSRTISGHEALSTVYSFFNSCTKEEYTVFKIILLKEAINFGASLINKVRKGWIPEFKLMLADADQPKIDNISFPIIAQTKLDGFRAVYIPTTQSFIGRNGKPIRNENLKKHFTKMIVKNETFVLDGELYSDKLSFNEISSRLNSENKDLTDIYYCLYDIMSISEWSKQSSNQSYQERTNLLQKYVPIWEDENVRIISGKNVSSPSDLQDYYKECLNKGYEGLMLKDPNGKYQWKRVSCKSGIMMKLKPHEEYDGKIIGYEEGQGQYVGTLGVLIVEVENIKNPVKVGSGFTEELRKKYWEKKETLIGQWIRLKGFEITENNESLRFPVFLAIRDSKED